MKLFLHLIELWLGGGQPADEFRTMEVEDFVIFKPSGIDIRNEDRWEAIYDEDGNRMWGTNYG